MSNMKTVKELLGFYETTKTAKTRNKEGFPAWKREGLERLREILFLGHVGNTFYANEASNILSKIEDLNTLIVESDISANTIKELIVSARQDGFFRTIPILALVLLRKRDSRAFKEIFNEVILTGQDLKDFLDLNHQIFEGFGRAVKTAIHNWLKTKVTEFYAIKYRSNIADAISVSRPKVDDYNNSLLLKYIYGIKKSIDKETLKSIFGRYKQIEAAEKFKVLMHEGLVSEAVEIARAYKLPADLLIAFVGENNNNREFWATIMNNMGLMQFIKYINKLVRVGLKEEVLQAIEQRITAENLRKAKIFPYRLFIAYANAEDTEVEDALTHKINTIIKNEKLLGEKWLKYSWAICPDVSASMTRPFGNKFKPILVSGFFTAVLAYQLNLDKILMWDTRTLVLKLSECEPTHVYDALRFYLGGGTNMAEPIRHLIRNKEKKDIVVLITDSEHWASNDTVKNAWKEYKRRINPGAKLLVLEVVGYGTSQVDEEFARAYDVYTVFGWSESVFKWIELKLLK